MYELPSYVCTVLETLEKNGFEGYVVGGCVRDFLMGRTPNDFDVTTNALPAEIKKCFYDYHCITTGEKHGTIAVVIEKQLVEITTYRIDGEYSDSRHPETVTFSKNLCDDLSRRDFTVNAMAMNKNGDIIDIFDGRKDIGKKLIRTVRNAENRFNEDALRIMRGIRFASQLGFEIETDTSDMIHKLAFLLKNISMERIRDEFVKLMCGENVVKILEEYSDVIEVFIPEIADMYGFLQHTHFHKFDVWKHTLSAVGNISPDPVLRVTMLLHDIAKPDCLTIDENGTGHFKGHAPLGAEKASGILKRLRFSRKEITQICLLIANHRDSYRTKEDVKRMMSRIGADNFSLLIKVKKADDGAKGCFYEKDEQMINFAEKCFKEVIENHECYRISDMEINGNDLINTGVSGRKIGELLNILLEKIISSEVENNKEKLLSCAKSLNSENK